MNPRQFLIIGGIILLVLGILGFVLTPLTQGQLLGELLWFDMSENIAHTILGIVALAAAYGLRRADYQKWLVVAVGVIALIFGILGFVLPAGSMSQYNLGVANLENPLDNLLHLVVGVWALWAAFRRTEAGVAMPVS